ncbi:MAG: hypothetical protein WC234_03800, partial [Endomicrobiaceae bacterium]
AHVTASFALVETPAHSWNNEDLVLPLAFTIEDLGDEEVFAFSPGDARAAYNHTWNPAKDGINDIVDFNFANPIVNAVNAEDRVNAVFELKRLDGTVVMTWEQEVDKNDATLPIIFNGTTGSATDQFNTELYPYNELIVDALAAEDFELHYTIRPVREDGFLDEGYRYPEVAPAVEPLRIDNENPKITVFNDTAVTLNNTDRIIAYNITNLQSSELNNIIEFTVTTNDFLPAVRFDVNGDPVYDWALGIFNTNGTPITNQFATAPNNVVSIDIYDYIDVEDEENNVYGIVGFGEYLDTEFVPDDATGEPVPVLNGRLYKSFTIRAMIDNHENLDDITNVLVHITLPNDPAGNPNRENNPALPWVNGEYYNDHAEYFAHVNFVSPEPNIRDMVIRPVDDATGISENEIHSLYSGMGEINLSADVETGTVLNDQVANRLEYHVAMNLAPDHDDYDDYYDENGNPIFRAIPNGSLESNVGINEYDFDWTFDVNTLTYINWDYDVANPRIITFRLTVENNHEADDVYEHQMILLPNPSFVHYSAGFESIPDWFASELEFISEVKFYSERAETTLPPVRGYFDQIIDGVPEDGYILPQNYTLTPQQSITAETDIVELEIELVRGSGVVEHTVYGYSVDWTIDPDHASVWTKYEDGVALDLRYRYFLTEDFERETNLIHVAYDKEHPRYRVAYYEIAIAPELDDTLLNYATSVQNIASFDRVLNTLENNPNFHTITQPLHAQYLKRYRPANIFVDDESKPFPEDHALFIKIDIIDAPGVGIDEEGIQNILAANPNLSGWTIAEPVIVENTNGKDLTAYYQLIPNNPVIEGTSLVFNLGHLEDRLGHVNYRPFDHIGGQNSQYYTDSNPYITVNFTNQGQGNANIVAFQVLTDETAVNLFTDSATAPYIRHGENYGIKLTLLPETPSDDVNNRANLAISKLTPHTVYIYPPQDIDTEDYPAEGSVQWVELAVQYVIDQETGEFELDEDNNPIVDYYYLNTVQPLLEVADRYALFYKVVYNVEYENGVEDPNYQVVYKYNDPNVLIADNTAPVFEPGTIKIHSLNYSFDEQNHNYVIPNDNVTMEIVFDDVRYTNPDSKPIVYLAGLDDFMQFRFIGDESSVLNPNNPEEYLEFADFEVAGKGWPVDASFITFSNGRWVMSINKGANPDFDFKVKSNIGNNFTVTARLEDLTGNFTTATRQVEVSNEAIVPVIHHGNVVLRTPINTSTTSPLKFATKVGGPTANTDIYLFAPLAKTITSGVNYSTLDIEINVAHAFYIDELQAWAETTGGTTINGITFEYMNTVQKTDEDSELVPGVFIATYRVRSNGTGLTQGQNINFKVRTKRHPHGKPVFEQIYSLPVRVDGLSTISTVTVAGGNPSISNYISSGKPLSVTVTPNFYALTGATSANVTSAILTNSFRMRSQHAVTSFVNPAAAGVIAATGSNVNVNWTRTAATIPANTPYDVFTVDYTNIYGIQHTVTSGTTQVRVDDLAPVLVDNRISIEYLAEDNETETVDYTYNTTTPITTENDWTKITASIADPFITGTVVGTGINLDQENTYMQVIPRPETDIDNIFMNALKAHKAYTVAVTPATSPVSRRFVFDLSEIAIDTEHSNTTVTAFDLAVGMYDIKIYTRDMIGNTVVYTQPFYFNPAETAIQLAGVTAAGYPNVSVAASTETADSRHLLEALVSDNAGSIQGVRFELYYDLDNIGYDADEYQDGDFLDYSNNLSYGAIEYTADLFDPHPPYQANWNLSNKERYNWWPANTAVTQTGTNLAIINPDFTGYEITSITGTGQNRVANIAKERQFYVRTTAITQQRYIVDRYVPVTVVDDVAPVPTNVTFENSIEYNYLSAGANVLNISSGYENWPDVQRVEYQILSAEKNADDEFIPAGPVAGATRTVLNPNMVLMLDNISANNPATGFKNLNNTAYPFAWNFDTGSTPAGPGPGTYFVQITSYDYAGNSETIVLEDRPVHIVNPIFTISYDIELWDVNHTNDDEQLSVDYTHDYDEEDNLWSFDNVTTVNSEYLNPEDEENYINQLRVNVNFTTLGDGLNGVDQFRLMKRAYNVVRGEWMGEATPVDLAGEPYHTEDNDYTFMPDGEGWIDAAQFHNMANPRVYLFVPRSEYAIAENQDILYEFFVELTPTHPINDEQDITAIWNYVGFRIDNRAPWFNAPVVNYPVAGYNYMSAHKPALITVDGNWPVYDINDVEPNNEDVLYNLDSYTQNLRVEWSLTGVDTDDEDDNYGWRTAVIDIQRLERVQGSDYYQLSNWDLKGGSRNTFLGTDFFEPVHLRIVAEDRVGNVSYTTFTVNVDNKAPVTPITHYIHDISDPTIHEIPAVTNGIPEITIRNSEDGHGRADLRLLINRATLTETDFAYGQEPVRLFQQKPDGTWMPALYDHEAWNLGGGNAQYYEFNIDYAEHQEEGQHRFVALRRDILDNLEGDLAGNLRDIESLLMIDTEDENYVELEEENLESLFNNFTTYYSNQGIIGLGQMSFTGDSFNATTYNGYLVREIAPGYYLKVDERQIAVDLIVNVVYVNDIIAEIKSPVEFNGEEYNNILAGQKVFTADIHKNNGNLLPEEVDAISFERKVGNAWQRIPGGLVSRVLPENHEDYNEDLHRFPITFELLRSDVPQYDGLPWVPGVHLVANDEVIAELEWNDDHQKWSKVVNLPIGTYNVRYGIDLNNDGVYNPAVVPVLADQLIPDPKALRDAVNGNPLPIVITPWTISVDTRNFAQGIHEFRAVPYVNGEPVDYRQTPSTWVFIDNIAPVINNLSAEPVGVFYSAETSPYGDEAVHAVKVGTDVPFNFDVNEILVNTDDFVSLTFQWAGQDHIVSDNDVYYRKWHTANFDGNDDNVWNARNPLTDGIDNDLLNGIDDPAEANTYYYIRFVARDRAGNYAVSEEYKILVDASPAEMQITAVNALQINYEDDEEINIFNLPADTMTPVVITAVDVTEEFDPAHTATIKYQYKENYNDPWGDLETSDPMPVVDDQVLFTLPADEVLEGYFRFKAIGKDFIGNEDTEGHWVTVLFNNTDAYADMTFLSFNNGDRNVLPYENTQGTVDYYLFSNGPGAIDGNIELQIANYEGINFVAVEYSIDNENWMQSVSTVVPMPADNDYTLETLTIENFEAPVIRVTEFYIRAKARDINNNYTHSQSITVYNNVSATDVVLTWEGFDGFIVELDNLKIDEENPNEKVYAFDLNAYEDDEEITFTVAYENHPVTPFNIVNQLILTVNGNEIYNTMPEDEEVIDPFNNIYPKEITFSFTKAEFIEALGQDAADDIENTYE